MAAVQDNVREAEMLARSLSAAAAEILHPQETPPPRLKIPNICAAPFAEEERTHADRAQTEPLKSDARHQTCLLYSCIPPKVSRCVSLSFLSFSGICDSDDYTLRVFETCLSQKISRILTNLVPELSLNF